MPGGWSKALLFLKGRGFQPRRANSTEAFNRKVRRENPQRSQSNRQGVDFLSVLGGLSQRTLRSKAFRRRLRNFWKPHLS
jgi:hypothetical protein